jgi:Fe2+ or Zn2+ uptake regulation protein
MPHTDNPAFENAAILRRAGIRQTVLRLAVLDLLRDMRRTMSVKEINEQLRLRISAHNLSVLYSELKALSLAGVLQAHARQGSRVLYSLRHLPGL